MLRLWRLLYSLPLRLRSLLQRDQVDQELDEELRFYIEQRTDHEIAQGRSPEHARRIALQALGGIEQRKEECRDHRGTQWVENFAADLRHGLRSWRKTPGIWALATLTLGLGIGANATVLSLVDKIWKRPIASLDASSQCVVQAVNPNQGNRRNSTTLVDYLAWRNAPFFEVLSAYRAVERVISSRGEPERIVGQAVSPGFFALLKTPLALGRFPLEAEHQPGVTKVLILSYNFWQNRFEGDRSIVGSTIRLDDANYTVIGVAAKGYWFPSVDAKFWAPLELSASSTSHKEGGLQVIGQLKQGVTRQQAAATLASYSAELERRYPDSHTGTKVEAKQIFDGFYSEDDKQILLLLYLISAGVLLISCANVANLLIARGLARRREMTIRIALGASRWRVIAQSLAEGLLLAIPALAVALLAADACSSLLLSQVRVPFPIDGPVLELRFFLVNLGIAFGSVFCFGLFPAWAATHIAGDSSSRSTLGRTTQRATKSLVVIQVALGLALVMTAILGTRGVQIFFDLSPGYDRNQVLRAEFYPSRRDELSKDEIKRIHERLLTATAASREFQSVGLISPVPSAGAGEGTLSRISAGTKPLAAKENPSVHFVVASPSAIDTLRIPILRGRSFSETDIAAAPRVAIINQKLSELLFANRNPIGQSIQVEALGGEAFEIVGLYPNLQGDNVASSPKPQFFVPFDQAPRRSMQWVGRMNHEKAAINTLRRIAHEIDAQAPIEMETLMQQHANGLQNSRVLIYLIATFAFLALFFGGSGLFAVVSQAVSQRLPEIGLRMALGASTANIERWVLGSGFRLLALGAVLGLGLGLLLGSLLAKQMVRVAPYDWQVILPSALLFVAVGIAACAVPALRAARTDITRVIRQD
jgi:putative ABC transport system permease protein